MAKMADFFPLEKGLVLEYELRDGEGEGRMRFEVLSVESDSGVVKAKCRRAITRPESEGSRFEYTAAKAKGWLITSAWGKEFPLPPVVGKKWRRDGDACLVDALDASAKVPAGDFRDCLRVLRLAAGGDEGSEERLYAPGVGLVRAFSSDERDPYELSLLRRSHAKRR